MSVNTAIREAVPATSRADSATPMLLARAAAILYLIITFAAIVAHMYVPSTLIVPGDAAATATNIATSEQLFRFGGIGAEMIVLLSEVVLSIILYVLLRPVNRTLSLFAAVSRLVMTTIHAVNLLNYFFILILLGDATFPAVFNAGQVEALVSLFLEAHTFGFTIGIAFLTLHVFALGYLIFKSGYIPRVFGVLFLIAGVGYLIDSTAILLLSGYQTPDLLALPIALAELAFPLWLLVKGVNAERYQVRVSAAD